MSIISLTVRAYTIWVGVGPIEDFGAVAGGRTGCTVREGVGGPTGGLSWVSCGPGLGWLLCMAGSEERLAARERFEVRIWRSSSPEAGRRRECGAII